MAPTFSSRILVIGTLIVSRSGTALAGAAFAQKDNRQAIRARPAFLRNH
jgi:hypothetical protein